MVKSFCVAVRLYVCTRYHITAGVGALTSPRLEGYKICRWQKYVPDTAVLGVIHYTGFPAVMTGLVRHSLGTSFTFKYFILKHQLAWAREQDRYHQLCRKFGKRFRDAMQNVGAIRAI